MAQEIDTLPDSKKKNARDRICAFQIMSKNGNLQLLQIMMLTNQEG